MIEIIVGIFLLFVAIFIFSSFYEIILIIGGMALAGYGLELYKNNGKNPITIVGFAIVVFAVIMLFVEVDEPGHSAKVAEQEAAVANEQKQAIEKEKAEELEEKQAAEKAAEEAKVKEREAAAEKQKELREARAKETAAADQKAKEEAEKKAQEKATTAASEAAPEEVIENTDRDCGDFASHEEVISFWTENNYNAANDPHELDSDSDGLPCDVAESELYDIPIDTPSSQIYYDNCTAVRNAGANPIRTGDPGYGSHLDRDGDGIACE